MEVAEAITVFFVGAIILAPVGAVSARFAMKPLVAMYSRRLATDDLVAKMTEQARRIETLESELAEVSDSLRALTVESEFHRQLAAPAEGIAPKAKPASSG